MAPAVRRPLANAALALVSLTAGGCDPNWLNPSPVTDAGASPAKSLLARPLATAAPQDAGAGQRDGGEAADRRGDAAPPPPRPLSADSAVERDAFPVRELSGLTLVARWLPLENVERSLQAVQRLAR